MKTIYRKIHVEVILLLSILMFNACSNTGYHKHIEASGSIEAIEVNVPVKSGGQIKEIRFEEGQKIAQGDTIGVIDGEILSYQVSGANAALKAARAQYSLIKKGARNEDIQTAEDNLKSASADFESVKIDYERLKSLFDSGSATAKQMQDMEARFTASQARMNTATEQLHKMKNIARPEELDAAKAQADRAESEFNILKRRFSDCYITSPIAGVAVIKAYETGELANTGATFARIISTDTLELKLYIPEDKLGLVKLGQKAEILSDTFENRVFKAYIVYISPEAEFTPKNIQTKEDRVKLVFMVKLKLVNEEDILKPGMQVDAKILLD